MKTKLGRFHVNKRRMVFVATGGAGGTGGGCPTMALTTGADVKFKDDYYGRLRVKKSITKALFG